MAVIVAAGLAQAHCHVETVANGLLAIEHARCKDYGLVVLDLTLPGLDGLDVCRRLRQARNDVPILVISGRTGLDDRVQALDAGADDYIVKPFDLPELLARVRAVTRRGRSRQLDAVLAYGPLLLDTRDHVISCAGTVLELTATEYRLLAYLMKRAEAVVTRDELVHHVWGGNISYRSNTVEVYVSYVRQALAAHAGASIHTVRGLGYVLKADTSS